jgi:hypothetical protein
MGRKTPRRGPPGPKTRGSDDGAGKRQCGVACRTGSHGSWCEVDQFSRDEAHPSGSVGGRPPDALHTRPPGIEALAGLVERQTEQQS